MKNNINEKIRDLISFKKVKLFIPLTRFGGIKNIKILLIDGYDDEFCKLYFVTLFSEVTLSGNNLDLDGVVDITSYYVFMISPKTIIKNLDELDITFYKPIIGGLEVSSYFNVPLFFFNFPVKFKNVEYPKFHDLLKNRLVEVFNSIQRLNSN
jgi:hypothetical protein